jgi:hypothetical protein
MVKLAMLIRLVSLNVHTDIANRGYQHIGKELQDPYPNSSESQDNSDEAGYAMNATMLDDSIPTSITPGRSHHRPDEFQDPTSASVHDSGSVLPSTYNVQGDMAQFNVTSSGESGLSFMQFLIAHPN